METMCSNLVDAHQHFWDLHRYPYPWMSRPELKVLCRSFLPEDLRPILRNIGIDKTVLIQARSSLDETCWFLNLAEANDFIAGVVGWVDLTAPDLGGVLDELMQYPKFKGVRHQAEEDSDDAWLNRPDVLRGFGELARRGLSYDLLVKPKHLRYIPVIAEHVPGLRMVVDHLAKPSIASRQFEPWATDLAAVARIPNLWCKLSGMITESDWRNWTSADFKPYIDHVIKHFGFDRIMFGSDWPVCMLAGTYEQTLKSVDENLGKISGSQRTKIFGENAKIFYRLA